MTEIESLKKSIRMCEWDYRTVTSMIEQLMKDQIEIAKEITELRQMVKDRMSQ